jgi:hypothetical protein
MKSIPPNFALLNLPNLPTPVKVLFSAYKFSPCTIQVSWLNIRVFLNPIRRPCRRLSFYVTFDEHLCSPASRLHAW